MACGCPTLSGLMRAKITEIKGNRNCGTFAKYLDGTHRMRSCERVATGDFDSVPIEISLSEQRNVQFPSTANCVRGRRINNKNPGAK